MPNRIDPNTRTELYLNKMAGGSGKVPDEPITRKEMYLAKAIGQNVTTPEPITREEMYLDAIAKSGGGGGSGDSETTASQKDVNFIDYDGAILYSYTAAEFAELTALPANPSHSGLTAQGWNWSLADAKAYVAKYGKLWIGQMYITDDGKTRVYVHLEEGRTSPMLGCCPNGTVVVDWGDGSATETLTGTSLSTVKWTSTHNYASAGDYVITLEVTSGTLALSVGDSGRYASCILNYSSDDDPRSISYLNSIKKVELGKNAKIGFGAFPGCYSLSSITIPSGMTSIGSNAFYACYSLVSITIPDGVISIEGYAFTDCHGLAVIANPSGLASIEEEAVSGCYSLSCIPIPSGVTNIGDGAFSSCYSFSLITIPSKITSISPRMCSDCQSLISVSIPNGVTSIGGSAFFGCSSLAKIRFEPTTPPTVSNRNTLTGIPTDCVISVPTGTLSAYTSATNYPDPATYTYIEED